MPSPLVVIDTGVVIGAVLGSAGSSNDRVLRAVATGAVRLAVSDDFLSELAQTMSKPSVKGKISRPDRAFVIALDLGVMGFLHRPRRLDWPSIPDQEDWWMPDLAFASEAIVTWDRHLMRRRHPLRSASSDTAGTAARRAAPLKRG